MADLTKAEGIEELVVEPITDLSKESLSLDGLTKLLCGQRLSMLEDRSRDEFTQLRNRQFRIRLLHNLVRAINAASDAKGNFDSKTVQETIKEANDQLHKELDQLHKKLPQELMTAFKDKFSGEARPSLNQLRDLVAGNGDWATSLEALEQDIAEVEDVARAMEGIKDSKGNLKTGGHNKEERDRWLDILRTTSDDLSMLHQMQVQTVNRLNNERNETLLMSRTIMKTLHEDKISKARAMAGR